VSASPAIYNVIPCEGHWKMTVNDREYGKFVSERDAIRIAIATAHKAGQLHFWGAQVILHGANSSSQIIWTYGRDPFPPTQYE
jgi:hypothetical protein